MWKEYTREKPARRGWTVATMLIAFIATMGLAQLQVNARSAPGWKVAETFERDNWPLSFDLPEGFEWTIEEEVNQKSLFLNLIASSITGDLEADKQIFYVGKGNEDYGRTRIRFSLYKPNSAVDVLDMHIVQFAPYSPVCGEKAYARFDEDIPNGIQELEILVWGVGRENYIVKIQVESQASARENHRLAVWVTDSVKCKRN